LRNCGHDELRIERAPGKSGEALADEAEIVGAQAFLAVHGMLNQAPGVSAVGGAQDASAVVGVENIVGIAGAGEDDTCLTRLHSERADADGSVRSSAERGH
jgi:hypothetical protein